MNQQQRVVGARRSSEVRVVVDSVKDYAIFQLDVDGTVLSWNEGARAIKGYLDEEVLGTSFTRFYTDEDRESGKPWRLLAEAAESGRVEDIGWRVRADGSRFWADVVVSAVYSESGEVTGFVKVTRDLTEQRAVEEATKKRALQNAAAAELGLKALEARSMRQLFVQAAATAGSVLDAEVVGVFEVTGDDRMTTLRAGLGWPRGAVGSAQLPLDTLLPTGKAPAVIGQGTRGVRLLQAAPLVAAGVTSAVVVPVLGSVEREPVYGALLVGARQDRRFDDDDMHFLIAVVTMLAASISRARVSRALRLAEHETEEERVARERAEQALHERDEFISIAAHELRTPITSLQLKLQTLERALSGRGDEWPAGKLATRVAGALRQVIRLGELVERLLDVTHLSEHTLELGVAELDVGELVRHAAEEFGEQARASGSELHVTIESSATAVWDRQRMTQALANLISNAIKYGAGQPVEVRVFLEGERCVIEVEDRGIGVSEKDAERIFARFERAVSARHYGGLGLGLFITREIVEAHQGTVSLRPAQPQGAVFRLEVPLRPDFRGAARQGATG